MRAARRSSTSTWYAMPVNVSLNGGSSFRALRYSARYLVDIRRFNSSTQLTTTFNCVVVVCWLTPFAMMNRLPSGAMS